LPATRDQLDRWERVSEWPLALAAIAFLGAYAWPVLEPSLTSSWRHLCQLTAATIWVLFIVDYAVRLTLAPRRLRYFWRHLFDLAVLILPFLRPLRLVMLLRVLNRRAAAALRGRIVVYVSGASSLLIFCAALAVLDAERGHPGANIEHFGDALWWSVATMTTVGYGDHFPVTGEGRFVAALLMVGGVALLGVVTASLASWLISRVEDIEETSETATRADVAALRDEVRELRALLVERQG
jgi:voltage-gated potassium channel